LLRYAVLVASSLVVLRLHEADRRLLRRPPFTPPSGSAAPGSAASSP
jgi:hypothetical protein